MITSKKTKIERFSAIVTGGHKQSGYINPLVVTGINDQMGKFIAEKTVKIMIKSGRHIKGSRVGVCGLTFKEDCPDLRNSRTPDIVAELQSYGMQVMVHDPLAIDAEAVAFYGIQLNPFETLNDLDALIVSVAHGFYRDLSPKACMQKLSPGGCIVDVKSIFKSADFEDTGFSYWRL